MLLLQLEEQHSIKSYKCEIWIILFLSLGMSVQIAEMLGHRMDFLQIICKFLIKVFIIFGIAIVYLL